MKIANIIIIHYTFGWTQDLIESWERHLPNQKLIVFNNNPRQGQTVQKTRGSCGGDLFLNHLCQMELNYLNKNKFVSEVVDIPKQENQNIERLFTHGQCLDFIFNWSLSHGFKYLLHIEPDCWMSGAKWFYSMIEKIENNWVVGAGNLNKSRTNYVMEMCPTIWSIPDIISLLNQKQISFEKNIEIKTNTGQQVMKECLDLNKCETVGRLDDFVHFNDGTTKRNMKSVIKLF